MNSTSLTEFIERQNRLSNFFFPQVNLLNSPAVDPISLLNELRGLGRYVQFISLDDLSKDMAALLPERLSSFLRTGFDVVLIVHSVETLVDYLDILIQWKFKQKIASESKGRRLGILYLLLNRIKSSSYPVRLQSLVDFEYQKKQR